MSCTNEDCGRFFDAMDALFIVALPPGGSGPAAPTYLDEANTLTPLLRDRLRARASGAPAPAVTDAHRDAARTISRELLTLVRRHFPREAHATRIDLACVQTCFVRFAYGELRTGTSSDPRGPEREPNGPDFFLFTEWALLAIELGLDADVWTELLRSFAKSVEVFLVAYPPSRGSPGSDPVFRPRRYRRPPRLSEAERRRLHDEYEDKSRDEVERRYRRKLREANEQRSVAWVEGTPMGGDQYAASLHYASLLASIANDARAEHAADEPVDGSLDSLRQLLTLEPEFGPRTMPARIGILGNDDPADVYGAARRYVAAVVADARLIVDTAGDRTGGPEQHKGPDA